MYGRDDFVSDPLNLTDSFAFPAPGTGSCGLGWRRSKARAGEEIRVCRRGGVCVLSVRFQLCLLVRLVCVGSPVLPRLGLFGLNVETQPLGKDHSSADIQTRLLKMHLMLTKALIIKSINHHNLTRHILADVNCPFKKYSLLCCTEFKD